MTPSQEDRAKWYEDFAVRQEDMVNDVYLDPPQPSELEKAASVLFKSLDEDLRRELVRYYVPRWADIIRRNLETVEHDMRMVFGVYGPEDNQTVTLDLHPTEARVTVRTAWNDSSRQVLEFAAVPPSELENGFLLYEDAYLGWFVLNQLSNRREWADE